MTAESGRYDLIVIGAGVNGAAIAREAALSGLHVLLLEQSDIGSGTSAASTRLIHGGLRYLEHAELGLVRESLAERERLLETAPHLVAPLELMLPLYSKARRKPWQIRAGMWLYDLLSFDKSVPGHRMLDRAAIHERLPSLTSEGLLGGAAYFDAQVTYPERLVLENVVDAVGAGAELKTHTRATGVRVEQGRVRGVEWQGDSAAGFAAAELVVNASGPWVDTVLGSRPEARLIGGTKGSHLVVEPFSGAPSVAVYSEAQSDGRPFFVIPWNGLYLIGTTDERFDGDPGTAEISELEFHYLVNETERLFPSALGLARHVVYTQAGVRPLPRTEGGDEGAITRRHVIKRHRDAEGLYSIIGGKLTTHRALAEDTLKRLPRRARAARRSPTRERPLPGALPPKARDELLAELNVKLGTEQAGRLWRIYGARSATIMREALARRSELGSAAGPASNVLVAELVHAVDVEWAHTLVDVLQRRVMAGLGADFGLQTAPAAAQWLVRLGLWDKTRAEAELDAYHAFARRFRVRPASAR